MIKAVIIEPTIIHLGISIDINKLDNYITKPYKITKAFNNVYYIYSLTKNGKQNRLIGNDLVFGNIIAIAKQGNKFISLTNDQIIMLDEIFRK